MAIYTNERRTREIGIRKVLGAEDIGLTLLLSGQFLKLLLVSVCISAPLTYFINNLWLQQLPNRVDFGFDTYGVLNDGVEWKDIPKPVSVTFNK